MGLTAADNGGGDFKQTPEGVHLGRCFRIIDLGDQEVKWENTFKFQHKVQISWELYGEDDAGQPLTTDDGAPLVVSKRYTVSLSPKANLRRDLESWRGKSFTEQEAKGFDISNLIGAPAMINVVHNASGDKTYANISSLAPVHKAMKGALPDPINPQVIFNLDDPDMELFETFYDRLKETIQNSMQWRHRQDPGYSKAGPSGAQEYAAASGGGQGGSAAFEDDDIPFDDPYKGFASYVV